MPRWTWLLQLVLTVPVTLILIAPLSLLLTSALHQTGQDGNPQLFVYIAIAGLTAMLFIPTLPFIHRYTYHIPIFLLFILIGTLIYNCAAFPFSDSNRVKLSFSQQVDLDRGNSTAYLTGVLPFVENAVRGLPSAGGQTECRPFNTRTQCSWAGPEPQVAPSDEISTVSSSSPFPDWVSFSITNPDNTANSVRFEVSGQNTRACRITMDRHPISNFSVAGSSPPDRRFLHPAPDGLSELRLWSRTWDDGWTVDVGFSEESSEESNRSSVKGRVSCLWSDDNTPGLIPALDEVRQYAPSWVAVSKLTDGLVEGYREFELRRGQFGWKRV